MRTLIFPFQDTTLYSEFPATNTGFDEIIEVGKSGVSNEIVRSLIQFDLSSVGALPSGSKFELNLYVANADSLQYQQQVEVRPVTESWVGGSGYFSQDVIQDTDGATWSNRQKGVHWTVSGSALADTSASVTLNRPLTDVSMDVTSLVTAWLGGSPNNGFVLTFPSASEADTTNKGIVKFFSNETHTIFRPHLALVWDDQQYVTGSLTAYPSSSLLVTPATLRPTYRVGETVRVDLSVREQQPTKSFATVFTAFEGNKYLPATSYFSIVDELSGTTIIPFSESSKISCDGVTSYFKFNVQNMYPLRYYRVRIKVDHDGLSEIFDAGHIFKVSV